MYLNATTNLTKAHHPEISTMENTRFSPLAGSPREFELQDAREPELYREQFPYTDIPRILFDGVMVAPSPAREIWITDTTFRDGQQARPPYTPEQIVDLFTLMHRLGGAQGVIRQCEFFVYSKRDRKAVEQCLALGYTFPEVTGWIRANADDFKLVKALGLRETGILTSVSDYHIFLKLRKSRARAMEEYLDVVRSALEEGVIPRCHFEDITRADIYGFCLPFAQELLKLSQESGIPVKIRLCDTMGYGVTYPGAVLPRSVPKLVHAFRSELGYPEHLLEWHGHNDFHKVHINGTTAWLYGCSALNASLLGFGERTGNPPLEAAIVEYMSLTGRSDGIDTRVITEIAAYFRDVVRAEVPENYPFVGAEFNTTRAGIHADGILKNPEIYNIFDTEAILNRPLMVTVTDKSGVAGIAHWLNQNAAKLTGGLLEPISKRHPGVKRIYDWVMEQYAQGRTTAISPSEMVAQAKRHLPEVFESEFQRIKKRVMTKARILAERISGARAMNTADPKQMEPFLKDVIRDEPFIQFLAVTDMDGHRISQVHAHRGEKTLYRKLLKENFSEHDWFVAVSSTGEPFCSEVYVSKFTGALTMTAAYPIRDDSGRMIAVCDVDFKFEELTKLLTNLPQDVLEAEQDEERAGQK
jgi:isopropylmalate/homocitrate/citramalate synthase